MLTTEHKKESCSIVYLRAIATKAGAFVTAPERDYGTDLMVTEIKNRPKAGGGARYFDGSCFKIQLKCSENITIEGDNVVYDLEADNYNDLVDSSSNIERILVLFHIPENEAEWITLDAERLSLQRCCYWHYLKGGTATNNTATKRIRFPSTQIFNHDSITDIFNNINTGANIL